MNVRLGSVAPVYVATVLDAQQCPDRICSADHVSCLVGEVGFADVGQRRRVTGASLRDEVA